MNLYHCLRMLSPSVTLRSPERCTSLLPPFGAGQRSHLPTPQRSVTPQTVLILIAVHLVLSSPGNLGRYLSCSIESPISSEYVHIFQGSSCGSISSFWNSHLLAGPLCQLSASRPPSRPASTHLYAQSVTIPALSHLFEQFQNSTARVLGICSVGSFCI